LAIAAFLLMGGLAQATQIFNFPGLTISAGDPTQLGRLSRNGIPQDWSGSEPYPGVINGTLSYHYRTLDLDLAALESGFYYGGFIQVEFDSNSANTFMAAYLNSYNPANLATNFLGDFGFSGDAFPGDPAFFQVFVPSGNHLVLVYNETTPNAGLGAGGAGDLLVEAFADTEYTDLVPSPEPGTLTLLGSGIALLVRRRFRRGTAA
jgi:hypothetical protein